VRDVDLLDPHRAGCPQAMLVLMPTTRTPATLAQSMSRARCTSIACGQPARRATSTSRSEFDELGAPITRNAPARPAIALTACWRLVVA
jgi:hypothetical protein